MSDYIGRQFGNYRILRQIGVGSFGTVYLAEHLHMEMPAAIKIFHHGSESDLKEARIVARLRHPHIIRIRDAGFEEQILYIMMDYMPNGTLRSLHPRGTRVSSEQIISYVQQIASALDYAHAQGVIHRDIKPDNLLLDVNNEIVLSDFGVALSQQAQSSLSLQNPAGTPLYMAPEQIQGRPCAASDLYALGVMVYEWLCGASPFHGAYYEMFLQHLHEPPASLCARFPELPPAVEDAVLGALAKDPGERFVSAEDFATALAEAFLATESLPVYKPVRDRTAPQIDRVPPTQITALRAQRSLHTARPVHDRQNRRYVQDIRDFHDLKDTRDVRDIQQGTSVHNIARGPGLMLSAPLSPGTSTLRQGHTSIAVLAPQDHLRLLRRVRSFWITGVLEQSLHGAALLTPGLQKQPAAVANPWQLAMQYPAATPRPLPAGTPITRVYDDADGELLILGAPGSGKTTLLLELARDLLKRAENDIHHPLPVIFNLSSWTMQHQPLAAWLVEELVSKYQVPRRIAQPLVAADQLLPLLDGLDEVAPGDRTACIEAINTYRQEHGLLPLVVCSRSADYLAQATRVQLRCAVAIQPLTPRQIIDYLASAGEPLRALRLALQKDSSLRELTRTPLLLNMLILTYYNMPVQHVLQTLSSKTHIQQILEHYVGRMLTRGNHLASYTPQYSKRWLSWLARQMQQRNQTVFYIERMQPHWSAGQPTHRHYPRVVVGLIAGLLGTLVTWPLWMGMANFVMTFLAETHTFQLSNPALIFGLVPLLALADGCIIGLINGMLHNQRAEEALRIQEQQKQHTVKKMRRWAARSLLNGLLITLLFGIPGSLIVGYTSHTILTTGLILGPLIGLLATLTFGLIHGVLAIQTISIKPAETMGWSWSTMWRQLIKFLLIGMSGTLLFGLLSGLLLELLTLLANHFTMTALWSSLSANMLFGLIQAIKLLPIVVPLSALLGALTGGLSTGTLDRRNIVRPNQGIRRSARHSLLVGGISLLTITGIAALLAIPLGSGLLWLALALGPLISLVSALRAGGMACIQHVVLRWLLWKDGALPWNYPRFLDHAAEHILLQKVGGGYMFVHRFLLEYFASLPDEHSSRS
ncbi:MAG: hypothetical protein NVS4B9_25110 [Ktedonobacteraceae bacterium]